MNFSDRHKERLMLAGLSTHQISELNSTLSFAGEWLEDAPTKSDIKFQLKSFLAATTRLKVCMDNMAAAKFYNDSSCEAESLFDEAESLYFKDDHKQTGSFHKTLNMIYDVEDICKLAIEKLAKSEQTRQTRIGPILAIEKSIRRMITRANNDVEICTVYYDALSQHQCSDVVSFKLKITKASPESMIRNNRRYWDSRRDGSERMRGEYCDYLISLGYSSEDINVLLMKATRK